MYKDIKPSNVFKINADDDFWYLSFASIDKFRENLTDEDVEDLKIIKIESRFLAGFISKLIEEIKVFEQENDTKVLNTPE